MLVKCNKSDEEYCYKDCSHRMPHEENVRCKGSRCEARHLIDLTTGKPADAMTNFFHAQIKVNSFEARCVPA